MTDLTTYSAAAVANFFFGLSQHGSFQDGGFKRDRVFTGREVQHLAHAAHGVRLARAGVPLIRDSAHAIEGDVVIPALHFAVPGILDEPLAVFDAEAGHFVGAICPDAGDRSGREALVATWSFFERKTAAEIEAVVMGEGSPWHRLSTAPGFAPGAVIPDGLAAQYFGHVITAVSAEAA